METNEERVDPTRYRRIDGYLRYLCNTRPNLNFSVGLVNRFMQEPNWCGNKSDRKSTTRYIFFYRGALISWSSTKEPVVALLSCEAEYIVAEYIVAEYIVAFEIACQTLMKDLQVKILGKIKLLLPDNKSTIDLARHLIAYGRSKHIETRFHFLREQVSNEKLRIEHCKTKIQFADILTKALKLEKFRCLRNSIGVVCVNTILN
ncbi:Copia protein, partial [Mucuna pruriens]